MKISFHKLRGESALGIEFHWRMALESASPFEVNDYFIPELFYDYIYVQQGEIEISDPDQENLIQLSQQTLKSIYTRPFIFKFKGPLVMYGARFSLQFAELFWQKNMSSNSCLDVNWVQGSIESLPLFATQISRTIEKKQVKKVTAPMVSDMLEESDWLVHYSQRHKRRLYKAVFGISRKEMRSIYNVHTFLAQACDFSSQNPRIIQYINDDHFYDQPHLNRAFKKMTGLSLLDYFEAHSMLQDNLMAASYNAGSTQTDNI